MLGPFIQAQRRTLIEKARNGLKEPPKEPKQSFLGVFALVGTLGGTVAALIWTWLERMYGN
jgi:uncharacterized protein involved in exopolysaccharide biosynthesis